MLILSGAHGPYVKNEHLISVSGGFREAKAKRGISVG
jgi:hypothetical protein